MTVDQQLANGHKGASDIASFAATFYNTFMDQARGVNVDGAAAYLTGVYMQQIFAIAERQRGKNATAPSVLEAFIAETIAQAQARHKKA